MKYLNTLTNGGQVNSILPDSTMLLLPIPSHDKIYFFGIQWDGSSFFCITFFSRLPSAKNS